MGGQRQRAEPGGDDGRRREREPQGGGAQHQPTAGRGGRAHAARARAQPQAEPPAAADDDRHEHDARQPLGGGRGGRRAGDAQAEAVDEQGVQADVRHIDADRHGHRRAGVLQAAQQPGRGEHDELEGQPGRDDPQIGDGRGGDVGGRPVPADDRRGEPGEQCREDDAERPAQGHAVSSGLVGGPVAPGAEAMGDDAGRRVGQEDAQARDDAQHVASQPQPGQRHGADVPDEGGVGHDEQRLGDERGEGGQGQRQQVTVGSRPQGHGQAGYPAATQTEAPPGRAGARSQHAGIQFGSTRHPRARGRTAAAGGSLARALKTPAGARTHAELRGWRDDPVGGVPGRARARAARHRTRPQPETADGDARDRRPHLPPDAARGDVGLIGVTGPVHLIRAARG